MEKTNISNVPSIIFNKVGIKIKGDFYNINSAVMEYADFPYLDEISKTFNHIENNLGLDEATKLKEKVIIGLLSQYALRPSELDPISWTGKYCHYAAFRSIFSMQSLAKSAGI